MASIFLINPRYETLIRRHGLDRFDRVMHLDHGRRMVSHASRDVTQIDLSEPGPPIRLYIKREWQTYVKDRLTNWLAGLGWGTKSRREWHVLRAMTEAGIGCAEPVAMAERGGARPQGYLIVRAIPGAVELHDYLAARRSSMSTTYRRSLARHLGRELARLHDAGIDHPDLYAKHIFLGDPDQAAAAKQVEWQANVERGTRSAELEGMADSHGSFSSAFPVPSSALLPDVFFIDLQRSRAGRPVSVAHRLRDLAALDATLPRELASSPDRLAFLISYLSHAGLPLDRARAISRIHQRSSKLRQRRKIREMHGDARNIAGRFVQLDDAGMFAAERWVQPLEQSGLASFHEIMTTSLGQLFRQLPDRESMLLELPTARGLVRAYLKRHRGWYPILWLRERLCRRRFEHPGRYEATQIHRLEQAGVRTMELIAFGQRFGAWGRAESFVLTREVADARPLDDLLRAEFAGPRPAAQRARLHRLIRQIAAISRRLHDAGYNHQDFYCCHFLVRPRASEFEVRLIDLQRVQYRRRFRHRWVVKDLGQLNYSAPSEAISRADRLRFLKSYLGVDRLGSADRRLVRQIVAKTARIARHDARKRGQEP